MRKLSRRHLNTPVFLAMIDQCWAIAGAYNGSLNIIEDAMEGNIPSKLIYSKAEHLDNKGYLDYGVSLRCCWLTEKGKDALRQHAYLKGVNVQTLSKILIQDWLP